MIDKKIIMSYALKNALEHKGKAVIGSVINSLFNEGLKKENIKSIIKDVQELVNNVNRLEIDVQEKEYEKLKEFVGHRDVRVGMPVLEGVGKKGVIMRFSPSPSGPLHIGHALTASASYLYIKKYGGRFYIRIEDTNPENICKPAYKMIKDESEWLFDGNVEVIIQSERMNLYYKYMDKLLKKNAVYVCTCSQENFKKFVESKNDCPCRNLDGKEQKLRLKKMFDKDGYKDGEAVLRFKSGMTNKNPAFRDFPLARINTSVHPLQGKKYKVWPLMNLAVAVDDIELKITHTIRAKDHRDNAERQKMIFNVLGKKYPHAYFLGRIHLKEMELSSSKMRGAIDEGKYSGWDDSRLLTIASLKKQGYKPVAFHKLAEQIGLNEVDKIIEKKEFFRLLNNFNH